MSTTSKNRAFVTQIQVRFGYVGPARIVDFPSSYNCVNDACADLCDARVRPRSNPFVGLSRPRWMASRRMDCILSLAGFTGSAPRVRVLSRPLVRR